MRFWLENVAIALGIILMSLAIIAAVHFLPSIFWYWSAWIVSVFILPSIAFMAMVLFIAWMRSSDDRPNY